MRTAFADHMRQIGAAARDVIRYTAQGIDRVRQQFAQALARTDAARSRRRRAS